MAQSPKPWPLLLALAAPGCSLGSFDYLSNDYGAPTSPGEAGATGAPDPCHAQTDGSSCDDADVCTRTSLCVAGRCQGMGDHPCVVADSVREYSMTQGLEGFWYGAWRAGGDTDGYQPELDFAELMACSEDIWRPVCVAETDPTFRWTLLMADLSHAATQPDLELPVRRWISDVSGPATATLDHHHADAAPGAGDGDGTRATLLVDGQPVWENEISSTDALGKQAEVPVRLELGTRVELILHPRANQARDTSHFSLVLGGK